MTTAEALQREAIEGWRAGLDGLHVLGIRNFEQFCSRKMSRLGRLSGV